MSRSQQALITLILVVSSTQIGFAFGASSENHRLWEALRNDRHFALIRHALAPGTGDPAHFTLERRDSQRNLSATGRKQAARIGELFREHGIDQAQVFSSQWFRCMDTAKLLDLGEVRPLPALNSFFQDYGQRDIKTTALTNWLVEQKLQSPLVLVTHQVNITALTGVYPASGEIVVVRKYDSAILEKRTNKAEDNSPAIAFEVVGRIATLEN